MNIGFVGLGAMGSEMARNLAVAGHEVTVYNRTRDRAQPLTDVASVAASLADLACDRPVVITMLADDAALEEVAFGRPDSSGQVTPGLLAGMPEGGVHISMSTVSPALSRRLVAAHRAAGQAFLSAPVFGRPQAAQARTLWIVVAGAPDDVSRCRPVFEALGAGVTVVGEEPWQANVVKLAGNFTIAAMIETLGEAYALVRRAGVESRTFLEVINSALYKSPFYQAYGTLIAEERFQPPGFTLELGLKDVRLAQALADVSQVPMPLAGLLHDHMLALVAQGHGTDDWSAFARLAAERAGLDRRG
jgi:3-hydroxyisobutyrate dehydrogenase-like beta-hydroxyacid dehydrogenase